LPQARVGLQYASRDTHVTVVTPVCTNTSLFCHRIRNEQKYCTELPGLHQSILYSMMCTGQLYY